MSRFVKVAVRTEQYSLERFVTDEQNLRVLFNTQLNNTDHIRSALNCAPIKMSLLKVYVKTRNYRQTGEKQTHCYKSYAQTHS